MNNIKEFLKISSQIKDLWEEYKGFNKEIDKKNKEIDSIFEKINEEGKVQKLVKIIESGEENFYDRLLLAKKLYLINKEKSKELLDFTSSRAEGTVKLLADSMIMSL